MRRKVTRAVELATLIETCPGLRLEEIYGTPYKTGQSEAKIQFVIDIEKIVTRMVDDIRALHGNHRAHRFQQWITGRQWRTFWISHRRTLAEDRDELIRRLQEGGFTEKK